MPLNKKFCPGRTEYSPSRAVFLYSCGDQSGRAEPAGIFLLQSGIQARFSEIAEETRARRLHIAQSKVTKEGILWLWQLSILTKRDPRASGWTAA